MDKELYSKPLDNYCICASLPRRKHKGKLYWVAWTPDCTVYACEAHLRDYTDYGWKIVEGPRKEEPKLSDDPKVFTDDRVL